MTKRVLILAWGFLAVILPLGGPMGWAQQIDQDKAIKVKAAYVLNFVRFTKWPEDCFANPDSPIVVGVFGHDQLGDVLLQTVVGQWVRRRGIQVRSSPLLLDRDPAKQKALLDVFFEQASHCHLIVIGPTDERHLGRLLKRTRGLDVLTVSDIEGFAERGGMVGLTLRRGRIVFDANPQAIARTRLSVSSKIMTLARLVETKEGSFP